MRLTCNRARATRSPLLVGIRSFSLRIYSLSSSYSQHWHTNKTDLAIKIHRNKARIKSHELQYEHELPEGDLLSYTLYAGLLLHV